MTILVAEDDLITLKTIEHRLKKDGHHVVIANDGREALRELETLCPDLVITDIMMPFSSGLEIIEIIKKKEGKKYRSLFSRPWDRRTWCWKLFN